MPPAGDSHCHHGTQDTPGPHPGALPESPAIKGGGSGGLALQSQDEGVSLLPFVNLPHPTFFFFPVLGFELRALSLLGKCSTT
jgi:hypothetical protein